MTLLLGVACIKVYLCYIIIEYGSTLYVGMAWEKNGVHISRIKSYVQNSAIDAVINFGKPYQSFSGVFMSNKSVSVARDHRWSTTSVSR